MATGSREELEGSAVNRVFALLKANCDSQTLCAELALRPTTAAFNGEIKVKGPAELLELLLAALKEVGPRNFLERTACLLPSGTTISPVVKGCRGSARRRVAILAGNFDPITSSHLTCAAEILHSHSTAEVWLVPARGLWRTETHDLASPIDRYCMCQIAVNTEFSSTFAVKVMDIDVLSTGSLYIYDLLCLFKERHPDKEFCFVIGSDRLLGESSVSTWKSINKNWKEGDPEDQRLISTGHKMIAEFDLLVIKRPGFDLPPCENDPTGLKAFGSRLSWLAMPEGATLVQANLGSDEIKSRSQSKFAMKVRDSVATKSLFAIDGLVARSVLCYIWRHRLYMPSEIQTPSRKRVAIYGGAFDPITNAHLTCASEIVHSRCADEVWIVPCGPRPDKPGLKTLPLDRYCMCQIGVSVTFLPDFPIRVSDIECFSEEAFPTYDLLCSLRAKNPLIDFSFIIGSDWLQPGSNMAAWTSKNWDWKPGDPEDQRVVVTGQKMLNEFDFLVIKRPGYDVPFTAEDPTGLKSFGPRLSWMSMQEGQTYVEGNLSSTEIRKRSAMAARVRDGISAKDWDGIDGLVPGGVRAYIRRRGLYNSSFD